MSPTLPRLLVIDDLFGRDVAGASNADRESLCAHFRWKDVTGDEAAAVSRQRVLKPEAEAVFCRAQRPARATIGDIIENDVQIALDAINRGPASQPRGGGGWAMILLDLSFATGRVTAESHRRAPGTPEGRTADDEPTSYFGLTLLDAIHRAYPDAPVIVLSSRRRDEVSLEFTQYGALGFIARDDPRAPTLMAAALDEHGLLQDPTNQIIGTSSTFLLALREARRAARHRKNVLIRGDRGTGKELIARYIPRLGGTVDGGRDRPFVAVNSAAFPETLFASELFGIQPRTATGVDGTIGLIELANRGDLFLDEIGDMPVEVQAALLRVLQDRQVTRVGGRVPIGVDVRFLSATNVDLESDPRSFRSDLLDRLRSGGTIALPRLRNRPTDIPLLAEHFVREAESQRRGALRRLISDDAAAALDTFDWPGNVRQLQSVIFDAVNRFPDVEYLVPSHLRLDEALPPPTSHITVSRSAASEPTSAGGESVFDPLLRAMGAVEFRREDIAQWAGRLKEWQAGHDRFLVRFLAAALDATKRRTPEHPIGVVQIHPAIKLMTGDTTISASRAADIVKRLLAPVAASLDGDLAEAYRTALRLRPKSPSLRKSLDVVAEVE